jgi:predicted membrane protein
VRRASGAFLFIIGIIILFMAIQIDKILISPVILLFLGLILWRFYFRKTAGFLVLASALSLIDVNIWALLAAAIVITIGYQLLWPKKHEENPRLEHRLVWEQQRPKSDRSFYRKLQLGDVGYELFDLTATNEIQYISLDLTKAQIPNRQLIWTINAIVGRVYVHVPKDLPIAVTATTMLGECEVLGKKEAGFHNHLQVASTNYLQETCKLQLSVSLVLGEVKVIYEKT